MKKRLLSMMVASLGFSSMFAYNVGDYVYTHNGRFKITGENLITNGDFSDGLTGWTNVNDVQLAGDTLELVTGDGEGPDGKAYIKVTIAPGEVNASSDASQIGKSANFKVTVPITNQNTRYLITYKAKSYSTTTTSTTRNNGRSKSYQDVYTNDDGSATVGTSYAEWVTYGTGWQEIAYDYMPDGSSAFLNILMYNLQGNDCFADFGIYTVEQVADDRLIKDALAQLEFYQQHQEDFPNEQETLDVVMGMLNQYLDNPDASPEDVSSFLEQVMGGGEGTALKQFLDANSVDVSQYFKNFTFDGQSAGDKKVVDGWTSSIGTDRWGVAAPEGNFATDHVKQQLPGNATLNAGAYSQTVDLPSGKYLYVMMAQAHKYFIDGRGNANNKTIPDYYNQIGGFKFFMNNDTTEMDSVPTWRGRTFMGVLEAGDGDKTVGFYSPGSAENAGGYYQFDNMQLRLIGANQEDVDAYFYATQLAAAKEELKKSTDKAKEVVADSKYIFGKTELQAVIDFSDKVYAELTYPSIENRDSVNAQKGHMDDAVSAYYKVNKEYTTLADDIATCKEDAADETRPAGKDDFNSAISVAETYYKSVTADNRDSLTLVKTDSTLMSARAKYLLANASYNTPADVTLVNNSFQSKNSTGWTQDGSTDNSRWKFSSDEAFTDGYCAYYNRGSSATDAKYMYQDVEITEPGVYEFKAEVAAHRSGKNSTVAGAETQVYLYIGGDSIEVSTNGVAGDSNDQTRGDIGTFAVRGIFTKDDIASMGGVLRVGIDKKAFTTNIVYIGSCHLYYYGEYDKYLEDSIAAVIQPTRDSLQKAIDAAQALYTEARNPNSVNTSAFTTAISTAQGVLDNTGSTIDQLNGQFSALETATHNFMISGVWPAKEKYYDLSFMIENADFSNETSDFYGWVMDGTELGVSDGGYLSLYCTQDVTSSLTQEVEGLPAGKYQFKMNATYRYKNPTSEVFDPENYASNEWMFVVANDNRTAVNGLLAEGAYDEASKSWVLGEGYVMSLYDYRHTPNAGTLFDGGHYKSAVEFELEAGATAKIGLSIENIPIVSFVAARGPKLHFWGDEVADGIDNVTAGNIGASAISGDVYTLSGVKVRSNATSLDGLGKGIYIVNGKKYVVK